MNATNRGRIHVSATGMCLIIPAIFGLGYADSLTSGVLCLVLFGLGWGFFDCNNMPILCQIARRELRATGYGISEPGEHELPAGWPIGPLEPCWITKFHIIKSSNLRRGRTGLPDHGPVD